MNLQQLLILSRQRLGDLGRNEIQITDEFLAESLNRGQEEAFERGFCVYEEDIVEITEIELIPEQAVYTLHPLVEQVLHARLESDGAVVSQTKVGELDHFRPYWTQDPSGKPDFYLRDNYRLQLYPVPKEADVLKLKVSRRPAFVMVDMEDVPELEARYHNDLTWYAVAEAALLMGLKDLEMQATAQFERQFGRRRSAKFNAVSKANPNNAPFYCTRPAL